MPKPAPAPKPIITDPVVKSAWAATPPITARQRAMSWETWSDIYPALAKPPRTPNTKGRLDIPSGTMLIKNDADHLYFVLDLTKDKPSAEEGKWFLFCFDVDIDGTVTSGMDVEYSIYQDPPLRMARSIYVDDWGGTTPQGATKGFVKRYHTSSPGLAQPHTVWEIWIPMAEITPPNQALPRLIRFGLALSDDSRVFANSFPTRFVNGDFSDLAGIRLATKP